MTNATWVTIALIIANLITQVIGTILAEVVKSRINQPKPTPELNQQNTLIHTIGRWAMNVIVSPFVTPPLSLLYGIYMLNRVLYVTLPMTPRAVLQISEAVAVIAVASLNFSVLVALQISRAHSQQILKQAQDTLTLVNVVELIHDRVKRLEKAQFPMDEPPAQILESPDKPIPIGALGQFKRWLQRSRHV